jgi:hypothetical protein
MAIAAIAARGTGASSTSSTSFTMSPSATVAVDRYLILVVSTDNTTTADGASSDHTSVSDTGGNPWFKFSEYTNTVGGAAADGVTVSVWGVKVATQLTTGSTITITLGTARTDKCCSLYEFSVGTGLRLKQSATYVGNTTDGTTGFGSAAFSGLASLERLYFRALAKEANSTTNLTASASFTAISAARSRNNAAAVLVRGEFRINTSTGETSNPTLSVSGDTSGIFLALEEYTPVTVTADQGSYSLSGQDAALTYGQPIGSASYPAPLPSLSTILSPSYFLTAEQGSYALTGQDSGLRATRTISAENGLSTVSGADASLMYSAGTGSASNPAPLPSLSSLFGASNLVTAEQGSYSLSGQDAAFRIGYLLAAGQGSYTLSGQDATVGRNRSVVAEAGSYALTGRDAPLQPSGARGGDAAPLPHLGLLLSAETRSIVCDAGIYTFNFSEVLADYEMSAASGSYSLAGQDAASRRTYVLAAATGSFEIDGQDAALTDASPDKIFPAEVGAYSIAGQDAGFTIARRIVCEQGFYALLGTQATFIPGRGLQVETGSYSLSGQDADIRYVAFASLRADTGYYTITGTGMFGEEEVDRGGAYKKGYYRVGKRTVYGTRKAVARILQHMAEEQARQDAQQNKPKDKPVPVMQGAPVMVAEAVAASPTFAKQAEKAYEESYFRAYEAAMRELQRAKQDAKDEDEDEEELLLML